MPQKVISFDQEGSNHNFDYNKLSRLLAYVVGVFIILLF